MLTRNNILKTSILFLIGGTVYQLIEFLWKTLVSGSPLHWTMFLLGGLCFVIIGGLNNYIPWEMSLIKQGIIGATVVTSLEFTFGYILNIVLQLGIWDYSNMPFNLLGQICLPFSLVWILLGIIAVFLDDWLRYLLFNEDYPHYFLITQKRERESK